jgi:uncharacterized glyoxalase superfamily protein PhnB
MASGSRPQGIIGEEFEYWGVLHFSICKMDSSSPSGREKASHTIRVSLSQTSSATEMTLGHNVMSKTEVDEVMNLAENAGAIIIKPAEDTFWWGYAGYFQDPDGHLWEVVYNPDILSEDESKIHSR